ncbi:MAG: threonine synthase [Verrucomicrobiia bacterium]
MSEAESRTLSGDRGVISRYRSFLPVSEATPVVSLNEGSTPLIPSAKLSSRLGGDRSVYIKFEGLNPTCSFKDRGMTLAISKAKEEGARAVICASTGNTSAAAAAYSARANLQCVVLLPKGKIATGKLLQAFAYGARVVALDGNFDDALRMVRELGKTGQVTVVNSINVYRIEGQKTAAFEVVDELGAAPTVHILPVGNAGNITAYWKGYREYHDLGRCRKLPHMIGFQAAGSAPLYHGRVIEHPDTCATAIRIGNPASWESALAAVRESNGHIDIVSDEEILAAQEWLAKEEGIFAEPASAASVAGLMKCSTASRCAQCPVAKIPEGATVVLTVTGHGLKDPDLASRLAVGLTEARPDLQELLKLLD